MNLFIGATIVFGIIVVDMFVYKCSIWLSGYIRREEEKHRAFIDSYVKVDWGDNREFTIHCADGYGEYYRIVRGYPVTLVRCLQISTLFIHKSIHDARYADDISNWVVSESVTGKLIVEATGKDGCLEKLILFTESVGADKFADKIIASTGDKQLLLKV